MVITYSAIFKMIKILAFYKLLIWGTFKILSLTAFRVNKTKKMNESEDDKIILFMPPLTQQSQLSATLQTLNIPLTPSLSMMLKKHIGQEKMFFQITKTLICWIIQNKLFKLYLGSSVKIPKTIQKFSGEITFFLKNL